MVKSTSAVFAKYVNQVLLLPVLLTVFLYFGKPVLVPLFFSIMLAMLMAPLCSYLDKRGCIRAISCVICVLIILLFLLMLGYVIVVQLADFLKDMDQIKQRCTKMFQSVQEYIQSNYDISRDRQEDIVRNQVNEMQQSSTMNMARVAGGVAEAVTSVGIVLVFTFLLLYHKEKYERFFLKLYGGEDGQEVKKVLTEITQVAQKYLTGRLLSMIFLFVLYTIALLIIGIKNALLLSAIASLLTIIPYIGPVIGGVFPFLTALVSENSVQPAIWVLVAMVLIQTIDNYFVEPNVIGGEVSLTALSTIIAIFIGGILWGAAGMILFIPMLSIAKIIFDHVPQLKPYGYVIGDDGESPSGKLLSWFKKK